MNHFELYRDEIAFIFAEASREIAVFPAGLSEIGQALLARSNPLHNGGGTNTISYLLPYWAGDQLGCPTERSRELAVGNIYAMLHFFLLDDVMDGGRGRVQADIRVVLALSQLLEGLFRQRYAACFQQDSQLWAHFQNYLQEWASAVYMEPKAPINPYDSRKLAGKAAPVKICATGQLILAGQPERIAEMEEAVDLALAILQLSDDMADWQEDLPISSNPNAFLTHVRETLALPSDHALDEQTVKRAIYHHQAVDRLADLAEAYGERLQRISCAPRHLIDFQSAIAQEIRNEALAIEESTRRLATRGGLDYFLSQF